MATGMLTPNSTTISTETDKGERVISGDKQRTREYNKKERAFMESYSATRNRSMYPKRRAYKYQGSFVGWVSDEIVKVYGDSNALSESELEFINELSCRGDLCDIYVIDMGGFKDFIIALTDISYEKEIVLVGEFYEFFNEKNIEPMKFILLAKSELTTAPPNILYHIKNVKNK
jgi:hypothetical protein